MLEVRDLHKWFGTIHAVRGISFSVSRGEVLALLGPNGAGKSTTMRMVTGFLPPSSGTAIINGYDITRQSVLAKKQIGYLPENAPVYRDMTVHDFLRFAARMRGYSGKTAVARADKAIEQCRLQNVRHQSIDTLSKGYRQRVCFAQAVLHDPPILIMDEPTDGLDPNQKHVVRAMIREMAAEKEIIISTHILEEVDIGCSRVLIIANGRVVADGTPADLKARSGSHGAVELTVKIPAPEIANDLRTLQSASRVEAVGHRYVVYPKDTDNLFRDVTVLLRNRPHWNPLGLRVLEGRLDDVFRELTAGTEQVRRAS